MHFAEFIAPVPVDQFMADHFNRKALHIQGGDARAKLLSMGRLEELLAILPHWTEQNLKLIINSRPVAGHHYLVEQVGGQRRADPAKVELFMRMGASLVADRVEDVDSCIREVVAMLGREFAGTAGANAYCSFKDVQAFNSHCDAHEVFAVQMEGEKVWRIYQNRADSPVEPLEGAHAQAIIDQAKGPVAMTVRMKPGDLLYIPRGYFHDALAQSDVSLHLTFAVMPLDGRSIFKMLEDQAKLSSDFRAYLPDARSTSEALRSHLAKLADEIAGMIRSPAFETKIAARQRALVPNSHRPKLQCRDRLDYHASTGRPFQVDTRPNGAVLIHAGGEIPLGVLAEPAEWALDQTMFAEQQLKAQFPWLSGQEVADLIRTLTSAGLIARSNPAL